MAGCKVKLTFLGIVGLLVVFHWSDAAEYDDDSDNEGKFHDLGDSELSIDNVKDEDAETSQANLDGRRNSWRRRRHIIAFDRRRRIPAVDRRRRTHNNTRRRWGW